MDGFQGRNLIAVTERGKKKSVRGLVAKDCLIWLAVVLRSLAKDRASDDQKGVSNAQVIRGEGMGRIPWYSSGLNLCER